MTSALPSRPNLEWLRKTARQRLRDRHAAEPSAKLSDVQFDLAREFGFSSWRALKAHIVEWIERQADGPDIEESQVAEFLRAVGSGDTVAVQSSLARTPELANAVGPHPFWSGRPQALHVAIETSRRDMFDLLLSAGADVNGENSEYEHTSPLTLTFLWNQPAMRMELLAHGAKVGLVEALLSADDAQVSRILSREQSALAQYKPNGGSLLAMARTPFAIDRLLELGVPHDAKDRWGTAPLEALSRLGPQGSELVRHLQSKGFEFAAPDYARMGDRENLERLLATNPKDVKSHGTLAEAAGFGHHDLVEWLLYHGATVNPGMPCWSALHSAAWEGDLRMVKILVAAGAELTRREPRHNSTPSQCARVSIDVTNNPACREVAEFLESAERGEIGSS